MRWLGTEQLVDPYKEVWNEHSRSQLNTPILVLLANTCAVGHWSLVGALEIRRLERGLQCLLRPSFRSVETKGGRSQGATLLVAADGIGSGGDNRSHHTHPTQ
jgi:hypothetical protein